MTNGLATWTDHHLGEMPGLGNDRPRGGAEIKAELDPGLAVVRYLYDNSRVDGQWSVAEDRGYSWWADSPAQRVWSEPAVPYRQTTALIQLDASWALNRARWIAEAGPSSEA